MESQLIKTILGTLVLAVWSMISTGQSPLTEKVVQAYEKDHDIPAAIAAMKPILEGTEGQLAYPHYVLGYLYKDQYKSSSQVKGFSSRKLALEELKKAMLLHPDLQTKDNINKAIRYLTSTLYNEALVAARSFPEGNEKVVQNQMDEFKQWHSLISSNSEIEGFQKEINKKLAERHYELWEINSELIYHPNECIRLYKLVLDNDPTDCEAMHNLAVIVYNIGVFKIKMAKADLEIDQLLQIQEEALELFAQALPFAQSTFTDCPKTVSQYKALMYIQRALGNDGEFDRLQNESEKLIQEGKLH